MAVDTVVTGVELSADKPFPERRATGVQSGVPVLVPTQHVGIFCEALREFFNAESLIYRQIGQVRLADESGRGIEICFLFPMDRNLRLADIGCFDGFLSCVCFLPLCLIWHRVPLSGCGFNAFASTRSQY